MTDVQRGAIGQSVQRLEDTPLLRGDGCYVGDLNFPNQLHMRIVRSTASNTASGLGPFRSMEADTVAR